MLILFSSGDDSVGKLEQNNFFEELTNNGMQKSCFFTQPVQTFPRFFS